MQIEELRDRALGSQTAGAPIGAALVANHLDARAPLALGQTSGCVQTVDGQRYGVM